MTVKYRPVFLSGFLFLTTLATAWAGGVVSTCDEPSLRAALAGGGTVTFATDGTIVLTGTLVISQDTTLDATGHAIAISGNSAVTVFTVTNPVTLSLMNLTVTGGLATGAPGQPGFGGGIIGAGSALQLTNCIFAANAAHGGDAIFNPLKHPSGGAGYGGAIDLSGGTLMASGCQFSGNTAQGGNGAYDSGGGGNAGGGAIHSAASTVVLAGCVFQGNASLAGVGGDGPSGVGTSGQGLGGAIFEEGGFVTNSGCQFTANTASTGPAISVDSPFTGASYGGAICNSNGVIEADGCLFTSNSVAGGSSGVSSTPFPNILFEVKVGPNGDDSTAGLNTGVFLNLSNACSYITAGGFNNTRIRVLTGTNIVQGTPYAQDPTWPATVNLAGLHDIELVGDPGAVIECPYNGSILSVGNVTNFSCHNLLFAQNHDFSTNVTGVFGAIVFINPCDVVDIEHNIFDGMPDQVITVNGYNFGGQGAIDRVHHCTIANNTFQNYGTLVSVFTQAPDGDAASGFIGDDFIFVNNKLLNGVRGVESGETGESDTDGAHSGFVVTNNFVRNLMGHFVHINAYGDGQGWNDVEIRFNSVSFTNGFGYFLDPAVAIYGGTNINIADNAFTGTGKNGSATIKILAYNNDLDNVHIERNAFGTDPVQTGSSGAVYISGGEGFTAYRCYVNSNNIYSTLPGTVIVFGANEGEISGNFINCSTYGTFPYITLINEPDGTNAFFNEDYGTCTNIRISGNVFTGVAPVDGQAYVGNIGTQNVNVYGGVNYLFGGGTPLNLFGTNALTLIPDPPTDPENSKTPRGRAKAPDTPVGLNSPAMPLSGTSLSASGMGGAIYNQGQLFVANCRYQQNTATVAFGDGNGEGGAIFNGGSAVIAASWFQDNSASGALDGQGLSYKLGSEGFGGAVFSAGSTIIDSCAFSNNIAIGTDGIGLRFVPPTSGFGGALCCDGGTCLISNSTLVANQAIGGSAADGDHATIGADAFGGALYNADAFIMSVNNTLSGNIARGGNGNFNGGSFGGGICSPDPDITLVSTILANSPSGGNGYGDISDGGHNISSDDSCGFSAEGSLNDTDPVLGPLADNGGPTLTMALLAGSPAIDAGDPAASPAVDQRGHARPYGSAPDIGAFESSPPYIIQGSITGTASDEVTVIFGTNILTSLGGNFAVSGFLPGTYVVTPQSALYDFVPPSLSVTLGPDATAVNFAAQRRNVDANTLLMTGLTNGSMHMIFTGFNGVNYRLLTSQDLLTWSVYAIYTVGPTNYWEFYLPLTSGPGDQQFYRIVTP